MKFLSTIILLIILHALYNLINYLRFNHVQNILIGNYTNDAKLKMKAKMHKNTILNYIKYSGVDDKHIPVTEAVGYGQIASGNVSVFQNILNPRQDIALTVMDLLLEAKGNYWSKFINSINPFYWLRIILYIPKYLLSFLGINSDSLLIKIFQLVYWFLCITFTILTTVFTDEVKIFITSFIHFS